MKKVKCINARKSFPVLEENKEYKVDEFETGFYHIWMPTPMGTKKLSKYIKERFEDVTSVEDSIVNSVINQFKERSKVGIKKYGTTLDRTDVDLVGWLQHLQEELFDATLYIEKLKQEWKNKSIN